MRSTGADAKYSLRKYAAALFLFFCLFILHSYNTFGPQPPVLSPSNPIGFCLSHGQTKESETCSFPLLKVQQKFQAKQPQHVRRGSGEVLWKSCGCCFTLWERLCALLSWFCRPCYPWCQDPSGSHNLSFPSSTYCLAAGLCISSHLKLDEAAPMSIAEYHWLIFFPNASKLCLMCLAPCST